MSRQTADIVIVGAGIIGLSVAHQISRRHDARIVVLEKALNVAEGSTGASCAILRQRYTHPEAITVARDGLRAHRNWSAYTGLVEPRARFHHSGVLWMMGESAAAIEQGRAKMAGLGIGVEVLDAAGVRERFPALSACNRPFDLTFETEHECQDHDAFLFETESGFFDPVSAAQDLLEAVRGNGVDVRFRAQVTGVRSSGGAIKGVDLADGTRIDAPVLVNAAGPWAPRLAGLAGFDYKTNGWTIAPIRAQVIYREWPRDVVPGPLPVVADSSGGIYFRPEASGQQILVGSIREEDEQELVADPDVFNGNIDAAFRDVKIHALHHRIPSLPYRGQITGVAGMYTMNFEDVHPVIGPTSLDGFIVANGFSGHGFKESPGVGSMLARFLTGVEPDEWDTEAPMDYFSIERSPIVLEQKAVLA
ncbi:MAG: FAD-dependent oxidoreductase [Acidimicrobiia bacterium]|nr:MAG: FAD-dependent oxidoreductase [Acidimicrobiia bacterium]